jgi:uncharacterized protein (DUF488 family)
MPQYSIYTIGHGQLSWEEFRRLLAPRLVEMLVDVRSFPYVQDAPWFNRDRLEQEARKCGWEYMWLGNQLGPLTEDGRVDNVAKEREGRYRQGVQQLLALAGERIVCLVGAQPDPLASHRHQLIGQTLLRHDVGVIHIMLDGTSLHAQADLFHHTL